MQKIYRTARHCITGLFLFLSVPAAHAQVVISEVHWVGSDISTADEWLEITAISATDISHWYITSVNSSGDEKTLLTFAADTFISSGEYLVLSNYDATQSRLAAEPFMVSTSIALPNSKLDIRLYNASGSLIDGVDDGIGTPFAGKKDDQYYSMERIDLLANGRAESNWKTSTISRGLDADSPVFGTPGFENSSTHISSVSSASSTANSSKNSSVAVLPTVHVTEVLSNPVGNDDTEWIEIHNFGTEPLTLLGITIQVGSKTFAFTNADLLLLPDEYLYLPKTYTGLPLPNKGGTVLLLYNKEKIEEFEYAETAQGVSYGKLVNSIEPLCKPSPGKVNKKIDQKVVIDIQSGKTKGEEKVTLNLQAKVFDGTVDAIDCYWEYSDGFRSTTCNPPSHTFEDEGVFSVELRANTVCGDSNIEVLHGKVYGKSFSQSSIQSPTSSVQSSSLVTSSYSSLQLSSAQSSSVIIPIIYTTEILISEVYPSPSTGEDEWIELYNPQKHPIEIAGWYLDDIAEGGSKPWQIPEDFPAIESQEYILFYRDKTKIALNNSGDDIRVLDPNGIQKIHYSYASIPKGIAVLPRERCETVAPTPGKKNICRTKQAAVKSRTSSKQSKSTTLVNSAYEQYVRKSYKNIVHNLAPLEEEKPKLLAKYSANTLTAGYITKKSGTSSNFFAEWLFIFFFIAPGWWFILKRVFHSRGS